MLVRRSTAKGSKINDNQKTAMVFLSPYTWPTLLRMKPSSWNPRYRSYCAARLPKRLIGDLAYDSDPLDQELCQNHRVELIAPTRRTGSKAKTAAFSDIIVCAGSSALENPNAFSLGHTTSVAWLRVGNITTTTSSAWCNLHMFSFRSRSIYEDSNQDTR